MLALAPLSALYGAAVRARLALYGRGALKSHRVGVPVISVGNITTGGTGKTPLVEWVARAAAGEGRRACVLTRGYGRADERRRVLVSDGERVTADAREGGDEPRLLAEKLAGVAAVVSAADRVEAARWAVENLRSEVFVLDDGFQHLRLARELDLVTVDATNPWGGGHLLPRGRLREPPAGLGRAGCVVITRANLADDLAPLREEVRRFGGGRALLIESRVRVTGARLLGGERPPPTLSSGAAGIDAVPRPAGAFCAVGNPRAFFAQLRAEGCDLISARAFADHHVYTQSDADALSREAESRGARVLLTTAKDAVKLGALKFGVPVYVVEIDLEFDDEAALLGVVRGALESEGRRR